MASSSAKHLLPFLLLTLLSALQITHARDSQFFNKIPATANNNAVPRQEQPLKNQQQQENNFLPENDNGYSLYGQESNNLPPSSAATTVPDDIESKQPLNKYRPKNYNPVAYVTEPEDTSGDAPSLNYNENSNNYPDTKQEEEESQYKSYPTTTANNRNNFDNYYGGDNSFNNDPQGTIDTRFIGEAAASEKYFNNVNGGETNRYQPQGMSDTRSLESGKYFYDVSSEKYSSNHPYTRFSGVRARNENSDNSENAHDQFNGENSIGGYQNQDDFQGEVDNDLP